MSGAVLGFFLGAPIFLSCGFVLGLVFSEPIKEWRLKRILKQERNETVQSIADALDKD